MKKFNHFSIKALTQNEIGKSFIKQTQFMKVKLTQTIQKQESSMIIKEKTKKILLIQKIVKIKKVY